MEANNMFGKFEHLLEANDEGPFYGIITDEEPNDIERDGGGKRIFSRVIKKPAVNLIRMITGAGPRGQQPERPLQVDSFSSNDDQKVLKFFYQSKIMEAIDSSVYMETVVSPTTPKDGRFTFEYPNYMKNEDDWYVVLKTSAGNDEKRLTCVHKDSITDADVLSLVTIYTTNQDRPDQEHPNTAIYFTTTDKKYHYYLVPVDSAQPQNNVMVKKVEIDKMSDDEIDEVNRRHLSFTQEYSNNGGSAVRKDGASLFNTTPLPRPDANNGSIREFKLSSDVEKD